MQNSHLRIYPLGHAAQDSDLGKDKDPSEPWSKLVQCHPSGLIFHSWPLKIPPALGKESKLGEAQESSHRGRLTHTAQARTETPCLSTPILRVLLWFVFKPILDFLLRNHFSHSVPATPETGLGGCPLPLEVVQDCPSFSFFLQPALSSGNQFKPHRPS